MSHPDTCFSNWPPAGLDWREQIFPSHQTLPFLLLQQTAVQSITLFLFCIVDKISQTSQTCKMSQQSQAADVQYDDLTKYGLYKNRFFESFSPYNVVGKYICTFYIYIYFLCRLGQSQGLLYKHLHDSLIN